MAEETPSEAILVVGTHRSGTSAFTGLLRLAGVCLGDELLAPLPENPRGFFENKGVHDIHENLLWQLGSGWYDLRPLPDDWISTKHAEAAAEKILALLAGSLLQSPPWGIKDPRLCRLVPLWKQVLAAQGKRACYVHCLRHPFEVAESLARRNRFPPTYSVLLWLSRLLDSEENTRGERRAFVTFDRLVADPAGVIASLAEDLSIDFPVPFSELTGLAEDFVSEDLRHHGAGRSSLSRESFGADQLYDLACECYEFLASDRDAGDPISADRMDELRSAYRRATSGEGIVAGWSQTMGRGLEAEARVRVLEREKAQARETLEASSRKLAESQETLEATCGELVEAQETVEAKSRKLAETQENLEAKSRKLAETQETLEATSRKLAETQETLEATSRKLAETEETLGATEKQRAELQETLDATREAFVFRMTAPLRGLERWLTERR